MKTFLLPLLALLLSATCLSATAGPAAPVMNMANDFVDTTKLMIGDTTADTGDTICMPVTVSDFEDILGFQFVVHFDPFLLEYDTVTNLHPNLNLNAINFGEALTDEGKLIVIYFTPLIPVALPDSATLFEVCFRVKGAPGDYCPVNIGPTGLATGIEIANSNLESIYPMIRNGMVEIMDPGDYRLHQRICSSPPGDTVGSAEVTVYGGNPPYLLIYVHQTNPQFSGGVGLDTSGRTLTIPELIPGVYDVSVTDEDGVRITEQFLVSTANELEYDLLLHPPSCFDVPDGAIEIDNLTGWVPPVYTKWYDGQLFLERREMLRSGEYQVTIVDGGGCRRADTILLGDAGPRVAARIELETCIGTGDGSLLLEGTGGTPFGDSTYQFTFLGQETRDTAVFADSIGQGAYPVTITDSLGCAYHDTIAVGPGRHISARSAMIDQPACFGDSTGRIELVPVTLQGAERRPYSFSWSANVTDTVITDSMTVAGSLPAGQYSLTISDSGAVSCLFDTTFVILQPDSLAVTEAEKRSESCIPGVDGSIEIDIRGGTVEGGSDYFILWQNGDRSRRSDSLASGSYRVTVIDDNNCIERRTFVLPPPEDPVITGFETSDQNCADTANGSAIVFYEEGSSPIASILWNNGDTTESIGPVEPGTYIVMIRDQNQCSDIDTTEIVAPVGPTITGLDSMPIFCTDDSSGILEVLYQPGNSAVVSVQWSTGQTGDTIAGLPAGMYAVTITDEKQCTAADTARLGSPVPPEIDLLGIADPVCPNSGDGSISVAVLPGSSPDVSLQWSTGDTTEILENLGGGTYTAIATDSRMCTDTLRAQVFEPEGFTIDTAELMGPSCPGDSNGVLGVTVQPGSPDQYEYLWSTGDTTARIDHLVPGTYRITVTDVNGCADTASFRIPAPDTIRLSVSRISEVTCRDSLAGEIEISILPGPEDEYHIYWSTGDSTLLADSLAAGSYGVTVTSGNGCRDSLTVELTPPTEISLQLLEAKSPDCTDSLGGSISIGIQPSDPGSYDLAWSNGGDSTSIFGLGAGTYRVTVTTDRLCADSLTVTLKPPYPVQITLGDKTDPACAGDADGSISVEVQTDTSVMYQVTWSDGSTGTFIDSLGAGEYTAVVMTDQHCTDSLRVTLADPPPLSMVLSSSPDSVGLMEGTASVVPMGGTPPYEVMWNTEPPSTDTLLTGLVTGWYTVTVTDANGCTATDSVFVDELTATTDHPDIESFRLYPVPAGSTLYFELALNNREDVRWKIINIYGNVIYEKWSGEGVTIRDRISVQDFRPGTYYFRCEWAGGSIVKKLIIQ